MKYQKEYDELAELVRATKTPEDTCARVCISLHKNFPKYNWAGIYRLKGQTLVLEAYQGKATQHTAIPLGKGVCGAAAASRRTEVVPDVSADARYLVCFAETESEIVVPIIKDDRVWGEIDIDSNTRNAFGPDDIEFLEAVARLLPDRL